MGHLPITGGAAFIGCNSVRRLLEEEHGDLTTYQMVQGRQRCRLRTSPGGFALCSAVGVRPYCFGARECDGTLYAAVVPNFIAACSTNEPATIFGDGTQLREFTFANNVVEANLAAIEAPNEALGQPINVACGANHCFLQLLELFGELLRKRIEKIFKEPSPGNVKHCLAHITRAQKLLGCQPRVRFRKGLERSAIG